MSKDLLKEQLGSFYSVGKDDFFSNKSQSTFIVSPQEAVIKNAEDEVVALILSAIVGSIIERYVGYKKVRTFDRGYFWKKSVSLCFKTIYRPSVACLISNGFR